MKKQLLGVIDATTNFEDLKDLIVIRSLAALPFGGRYRIIDFVLSNMVNSGIRSVAIFPKMQYRSLMDHLGSGKNWDLDRKRDGLFVFPNPIIDSELDSGGCSFQYFAANLDFFIRSSQEYSLITNCHTIVNMDFEPLLHHHMTSGCDITEVTNHDSSSLEMYLLRTSLFIQLINTRNDTGFTCMKDVVQACNSPYHICHCQYKDYAVIIDSLQTYYTASMSLLDPEIRRQLFKKTRPVYTKVKDEPPTRYLKGSSVQNSMIANGCLISGQVKNSILSREITIGKGSVVKNSIIMTKCQIGEDCYLDSVILDKEVQIKKGIALTGTEKAPYVVRKGMIQGALMKS